MAELETPEEVDAMNDACGVWHDGPGRDPDGYTPLAGFWAGWLAGRDYERQRDQAIADLARAYREAHSHRQREHVSAALKARDALFAAIDAAHPGGD